MPKYCLIYNGRVLYSSKAFHKKSGLCQYLRYLYDFQKWESNEVILFDTALQAKLWVLCRSSFPKFVEYAITANSEKQIDKVFLKGKYIFNKVYWEFAGTNKLRSKQDYPMVCEIIVSEYEE